MEELSQTAMLRIYATQQLAFVETESKGVIRLSRPGLPCRLLSCHDYSQPVEVSNGASVYRFVEREQACLMGQQLADGGSLLPLLRELRPVRADSFFVVEPPTRVGDGEGHRG